MSIFERTPPSKVPLEDRLSQWAIDNKPYLPHPVQWGMDHVLDFSGWEPTEEADAYIAFIGKDQSLQIYRPSSSNSRHIDCTVVDLTTNIRNGNVQRLLVVSDEPGELEKQIIESAVQSKLTDKFEFVVLRHKPHEHHGQRSDPPEEAYNQKTGVYISDTRVIYTQDVSLANTFISRPKAPIGLAFRNAENGLTAQLAKARQALESISMSKSQSVPQGHAPLLKRLQQNVTTTASTSSNAPTASEVRTGPNAQDRVSRIDTVLNGISNWLDEKLIPVFERFKPVADIINQGIDDLVGAFRQTTTESEVSSADAERRLSDVLTQSVLSGPTERKKITSTAQVYIVGITKDKVGPMHLLYSAPENAVFLSEDQMFELFQKQRTRPSDTGYFKDRRIVRWITKNEMSGRKYSEVVRSWLKTINQYVNLNTQVLLVCEDQIATENLVPFLSDNFENPSKLFNDPTLRIFVATSGNIGGLLDFMRGRMFKQDDKSVPPDKKY